MAAEVDPSHIMQVGSGFWASKTLLSAVELEVFTVLGGTGMTGEEIGAKVGLAARSTYDFLDALGRVAGGGTAIDPDVVSRLMAKRRSGDRLATLTDREREVLMLMAEGRSNAAIAQRLVVSERTVEAHIRSILTRLDIEATVDDHRRVLAVIAYLRGS